LGQLVDAVTGQLQSRAGHPAIITRERHRTAIARAVRSLEACRQALAQGALHTDIAAEELRAAVRALDSLIGRVDVENLLDEIFLRFCIGK
jgi:tRNA modification GTPase